MTTIAVNKINNQVVMASDSLMSDSLGIISSTKFKKIYKKQLPDGTPILVGGAGDIGSIFAFVDWIDVGMDNEDYPYDFCEHYNFIVATRSKVFSYEGYHRPIEIEFPTSIGSGADLALGAMANGATPQEAIKIAIKYDTGSGGRVQTLTL